MEENIERIGFKLYVKIRNYYKPKNFYKVYENPAVFERFICDIVLIHIYLLPIFKKISLMCDLRDSFVFCFVRDGY